LIDGELFIAGRVSSNFISLPESVAARFNFCVVSASSGRNINPRGFDIFFVGSIDKILRLSAE